MNPKQPNLPRAIPPGENPLLVDQLDKMRLDDIKQYKPTGKVSDFETATYNMRKATPSGTNMFSNVKKPMNSSTKQGTPESRQKTTENNSNPYNIAPTQSEIAIMQKLASNAFSYSTNRRALMEKYYGKYIIYDQEKVLKVADNIADLKSLIEEDLSRFVVLVGKETDTLLRSPQPKKGQPTNSTMGTKASGDGFDNLKEDRMEEVEDGSSPSTDTVLPEESKRLFMAKLDNLKSMNSPENQMKHFKNQIELNLLDKKEIAQYNNKYIVYGDGKIHGSSDKREDLTGYLFDDPTRVINYINL
jgi:hypothetical protein